MESICATLLCFLKEKEVYHLIELFLKNIENEAPPIRRSATKAIRAICHYAPVSPFDFVIFSFKKVLQPRETPKGNEQDFHYLLGVLHCCLHLVKLSYSELGSFIFFFFFSIIISF